MDADYELEDIRSFFAKRFWLHGGRILSDGDYADLMARTLVLSAKRAVYLRAFIDGWLAAKK